MNGINNMIKIIQSNTPALQDAIVGKTLIGKAIRGAGVAVGSGLLLSKRNEQNEKNTKAEFEQRLSAMQSKNISTLSSIASLGNPVPFTSSNFLQQSSNFSHNNVPMGAVRQ